MPSGGSPTLKEWARFRSPHRPSVGTGCGPGFTSVDRVSGFCARVLIAVCDPAQTGQLLPDTDQIMAQLGRRLVRSNDRSVLYVDLAENIDADQRALLIRLRHHRAPETVAAWTAGCALSGVAYSTRGQSKARVVSGKPTVSDRVAALTCDPGAGEHRLQRHARSFFQGNRYLLPTPVSAVYRRVTVGPVVDLYAGVGLFAVTLKRFSDSPCTAWARRGTSACTNAGGPMQAYSMDLRERALLDSDAGMKAADVAVKYRVSGSWVRAVEAASAGDGRSRAARPAARAAPGCWSRTCTPWPR